MDMYCHIRYEGGSRNLVRLSANRVCSRRVSEPGRPSPMVNESTLLTGMISMLVLVKKHSSA
jgi:hypothetical protein